MPKGKRIRVGFLGLGCAGRSSGSVSGPVSRSVSWLVFGLVSGSNFGPASGSVFGPVSTLVSGSAEVLSSSLVPVSSPNDEDSLTKDEDFVVDLSNESSPESFISREGSSSCSGVMSSCSSSPEFTEIDQNGAATVAKLLAFSARMQSLEDSQV